MAVRVTWAFVTAGAFIAIGAYLYWTTIEHHRLCHLEDLLVQGRAPAPSDLGREWRRYLDSLPETPERPYDWETEAA